MGSNERRKELKRRRHRRQKMGTLKRQLSEASVSDRDKIADKIRRLTPGAEIIIDRLGIDQRQ